MRTKNGKKRNLTNLEARRQAFDNMKGSKDSRKRPGSNKK